MAKQSESERVQEVFSFYRGLILDMLEQELSEQQSWNFIRSRILRALSQDRGLECRILEIITEEDQTSSEDDL